MAELGADRNLGGTFLQYFDIAPALDEASKKLVYGVRHDVYCRDLAWEPVRENGMETDEYDPHSVHCLLRKRGSMEPVGCTRLILARPDRPNDPLPFEESCSAVLDRALVDPSKLPRNSLGEVSRLAVVSAYRQRKGEQSSPMTAVDDENLSSSGPMPRFPFIPVSLYLAAAAVAQRLGIEHVFVLTEPRLASHFTRIGFDIRPVGGAIEHRGLRVPSLLSSSKVVANLRPLIRPLYEVVESAVTRAYEAHEKALADRSGKPA